MIVVYGIREKLNPIKAKLSDVIHECMQSVLGMPEDKRAHRFVPLGKEDFYYPGGRSDAYTVIEINMIARYPQMAGVFVAAQLVLMLSSRMAFETGGARSVWKMINASYANDFRDYVETKLSYSK